MELLCWLKAKLSDGFFSTLSIFCQQESQRDRRSFLLVGIGGVKMLLGQEGKLVAHILFVRFFVR